MRAENFAELLLFLACITVATPILGTYLARVFTRTPRRWESSVYRLLGVRPEQEMGWREYASALLMFNLLGMGVVFGVQMLQGYLPLNPQGLSAVSWHSSLNTAVSFATNTDWQGYSPENTLSYFTQMVALAVQNFLSAAVGLAVAVAFARGVARRNSDSIGNFWVDITRGVLFVLLPLSFLWAILLAGQGVVQTFAPYVEAITLEGAKQLIPLGPAASQVAIKQIGTNGGGFFNANGAHPFENPTPVSNFLELLAIFLIPAALVYAYGILVGSKRHAWVIWGSMMGLFLALLAAALWAEYSLNAVLGGAALMEGKETRFGVFGSTLFSVVTTAASCGAVNAMHASLSPLAGGVALVNMLLGEVIFGGVGAGLYGMAAFILLTVFIAGLMVGRTPEYLGKKIEAREVQMAMLAALAPGVMILLGTAASVVNPAALASVANAGPHGFSEIFYAFTSAAANNGSAFAGLNANTLWYNLTLAAAMLVGRFGVIVPILAAAGSLARKKYSPPSPGTFRVDEPLFALLLVGVILIVGGLTFFPALSLGPIVEHLLMQSSRAF